MNIYEEVALAWASADVVLLVLWHTAHVMLHPRPARAARTATRPTTAANRRSLVTTTG